MTAITVCACDSQPIAIEGLRSILESSDELKMVGGANSLLNGLGLLDRYFPSIMLLDRAFGAKPVLDWIASAKMRYPQTRTVLWATVISDVECFRAFQVGACGILKKGDKEAAKPKTKGVGQRLKAAAQRMRGGKEPGPCVVDAPGGLECAERFERLQRGGCHHARSEAEDFLAVHLDVVLAVMNGGLRCRIMAPTAL